MYAVACSPESAFLSGYKAVVMHYFVTSQSREVTSLHSTTVFPPFTQIVHNPEASLAFLWKVRPDLVAVL